MDCRQTQWSQLQPVEPILRQTTIHTKRHDTALGLRSDRYEDPDRSGRKTANGELDNPRRWAVQPLGVVDREDDRAVGGQKAKDIEDGARDGPLVRRWTRPRCPEQRNLQGAAPRLGEGGQGFVEHADEEIIQRTKGETRLRVRRAARRRTFHHGIQELPEGIEFLAPADDLACRRRHARPLEWPQGDPIDNWRPNEGAAIGWRRRLLTYRTVPEFSALAHAHGTDRNSVAT